MFIGLLTWFSYSLYLAYRITKYELTQGTILHSVVHVRESSRGPIEFGLSGYVLHEEVKYKYSVGGVTYIGGSVSRLALSRVVSPSELAALRRDDGNELRPRFLEGASVDVWYDPVQPELAVLDNAVDWVAIGVLASFLVMMAVPTIIFTYHDLIILRKRGVA